MMRRLCFATVALPCVGLMTLAFGCASHGPSVSSESNPWFAAASSGGESQLEAARSSGAYVNAHERGDYNTPLHVAAMAGNLGAVRFILASGGDINAVDEDGRTALVMALHNRQGAAAVVLIEANADLEIRDRQHNTALMFAARRGLIDAIRAMITRHVNLDAQNANGKSALHFAAEYGQLEVVRVLRSAGASTTIRDDKGRTPRDYAVAKNFPDIVKALD